MTIFQYLVFCEVYGINVLSNKCETFAGKEKMFTTCGIRSKTGKHTVTSWQNNRTH